MTIVEHEPVVPRGLVERAKNILINPPKEWEVIDAEPATIRGIYTGYLVYIAAISPVARCIGDVVFGHVPLLSALVVAVISYALWLVLTYAMALLIEALAPRFGGQRDRVQAFKVAAYSSTASAVAGIFALVPALSPLAIFGLYGLFLLWLGLPKLMRVAQDRALTYYAAVLISLLLVGIVLSFLLGPIMTLARV